MRKAILFTLAILLCAPVCAQKNVKSDQPECSLKLDQSPTLRGFRIGMTQEQVLKRLPGVSIEKPDKYGLARLRLEPCSPTLPRRRQMAAPLSLTA
jgi:hypothetical protein